MPSPAASSTGYMFFLWLAAGLWGKEGMGLLRAAEPQYAFFIQVRVLVRQR